MQCTVNEKVSSKTVAEGDPVLCQIGGRTSEAFAGAALQGQFQEYKDPGHFVGKGWMELQFDQLVMPNAQLVRVNAKVISVPGYHVDIDSRIHGKGHAVRDTITWFVPVLWPIDIAMLPRRGPSPTLKPESRITVKVMDNTWINDDGPPLSPYSTNPYGFKQRSSADAPSASGSQATFVIGANEMPRRGFWRKLSDNAVAAQAWVDARFP